ncbi:hypothetical protein [Thiocystis violacea]|uniref:hypothetical protein n=1 Tax=Thiocystis violacea TaxID=13725 RepID=UPI0019088BB3|nr:hypothetical protein [Thiocystis violacea]MBK1716264.1 hypothetical protein [Thiocystis violacea]
MNPTQPTELPFTHKPGRRERHIKRRHANPLFGWPPESIAPETLLAAQKADHEDMESFQQSFIALVQRAIDLPPDAGSERVLALKEALERHYEDSFGLPEDHGKERVAIRRLIELTMTAVKRAAGEDPLALQELADEEAARAIHFRLLEQPLVVDLLHPESPIRPAELTPTLLGASLVEVEAALEIFDRDQIARILEEGIRLTDELAARAIDMTQARQRLALILAQSESERDARRH